MITTKVSVHTAGDAVTTVFYHFLLCLPSTGVTIGETFLNLRPKTPT